MRSRSFALAGLAAILAQTPRGVFHAVDPNLAAAMNQVDAEANRIGATVQPIADRLNGLKAKLEGSMTPEEQAAAAVSVGEDAARLGAMADALTALGADAANPVPEPTPEPTARRDAPRAQRPV